MECVVNVHFKKYGFKYTQPHSCIQKNTVLILCWLITFTYHAGFVMGSSLEQESDSYETTFTPETFDCCLYRMLKWNLLKCLHLMCCYHVSFLRLVISCCVTHLLDY